jgi:hypothetical protein
MPVGPEMALDGAEKHLKKPLPTPHARGAAAIAPLEATPPLPSAFPSASRRPTPRSEQGQLGPREEAQREHLGLLHVALHHCDIRGHFHFLNVPMYVNNRPLELFYHTPN